MKNEKFTNSPYFSILKSIKKEITIAVFDLYTYYLLFRIKSNLNKCVIQIFINLLIQKNVLFNKNLCNTSNVL